MLDAMTPMILDDSERPRLDPYVTPISFIGHGVTRLVIKDSIANGTKWDKINAMETSATLCRLDLSDYSWNEIYRDI